MRTIGQNIKEMREARGMTQAELARLAGMSQQAIGHVETDATRQPRRLHHIAAALGCDISKLDPGYEASGRKTFSPDLPSPEDARSEHRSKKAWLSGKKLAAQETSSDDVAEIVAVLEERARQLASTLGFAPTPKQTLLHLISLADERSR